MLISGRRMIVVIMAGSRADKNGLDFCKLGGGDPRILAPPPEREPSLARSASEWIGALEFS